MTITENEPSYLKIIAYIAYPHSEGFAKEPIVITLKKWEPDGSLLKLTAADGRIFYASINNVVIEVLQNEDMKSATLSTLGEHNEDAK